MGLVRRAASLAAVPVTTSARLATAAASVALGSDKEEAYARAAEGSVAALASALASARGPALKFGQALATLAPALPEGTGDLLSPLTRLYESADPVPLRELSKSLSALPAEVTVEEEATAAASLGQVHRGTWEDGTPVAVKVQYPHAARYVRHDMAQLKALAPALGRLVPSIDVRGLVDEHAARLSLELDYTYEAQWSERFKDRWHCRGVTVPGVLFASQKVLVTEWLDGVPLLELADAPSSARNQAARHLARFCLWSPALVGATHADPHPGNFRLLDDGTLGVFDFGSVAEPSGVFTNLFCETLARASRDDIGGILELWRQSGLVGEDATAAQLLRILDPDSRPYDREEFTFSPEWLSSRSSQFSEPSAALSSARVLRFPPGYLLEHRAVMGTLALMCSLDATVDFRHVVNGVLSGQFPPL